MAFRYGVSLSGMIGSDSEDEVLNDSAMLSPDPENAIATQKGRSRANASKGQAPTRKENGISTRITKQSTSKSGPSHKRKALKEQTNGQYGSDTEEVERFEDQEQNTMPTVSNDELDVSMIAPKPKGRPTKSRSNEVKAAKRGAVPASPKRKRTVQIPGDKIESRTKKVPLREQQQSFENSGEEESLHESFLPEEHEEPEEKPVRRGVVKQASKAFRPSPVAKAASVSRRRAGSNSDTERVSGDAAVRRRLGEMTKKFEIIDLKYRNLREVAVKEAEGNFEKLKKQTDQKSKVANELIASLRADLAHQTALMQQTKSLQKELAARDAEISKMKDRSVDLSSSLQEVEAENRLLTAKLANLRNNSQPSDHRVPSGVVRGSSASRSVMAGNVEAAQLASLKEDLYGDLTGLMLRDVKRDEDADVYDCLQTGRNGTLHFKLAIESDNSTRHENGECHYTPLIDTNQDSALLELLPDYLTEEITFPRERASMFYARVVQALSKQVVSE